MNYIRKLFKNNTYFSSILENQCEIFKSFCCSRRLKLKIKFVKQRFEKLRMKFDWLNFIKNQNELELIKNVVFTKEQRDIVTLGLKSNLFIEKDKVKFNY